MRRIVKDILDAESRVGDVLKEARERASQMRLAAEKDISERMGDARREAQEIVQTSAEEARKEAERIREEALARADGQGRASLEAGTKVMEDLVNRICDVILSTDCETDAH